MEADGEVMEEVGERVAVMDSLVKAVRVAPGLLRAVCLTWPPENEEGIRDFQSGKQHPLTLVYQTRLLPVEGKPDP